MAKSKICVSFIVLFSFLLSSHVLAYDLPETSLEKQKNDEGKVFKERNPTSSYDLERKRRSGSSMPSFSNFVRQGYKTPSLEETGKGTLSKDIVEVDKLGLENRKWYIDVGFGDGNNRRSNGIGGGSRGSNGGMGSSMGGGGGGGQRDAYGGGGGGGGQGDFYGGGGGQRDVYSGGGGYPGGGYPGGDYPWNNNMWGGDPIYDFYDFYPEPMNYNDASMMRYQNMKKLSEFDRGSFRHKSQAKKFGMKNGGKIHYGGVPRMEDIGEEKRN